MDDYYEPFPRVMLPRPAAVAGFFGANVDGVTRSLCGRTGVPWFSIAREVEHRAGQSISSLLASGGDQELRRLEREAVTAALRSRPAPLIALTESTLIDGVAREQLLAQADLIYLRATLRESWVRINRALERNPLRFSPWVAASCQSTQSAIVPGPEALELLFAERLPGYRAAPSVLDIDELDALGTADALSRLLGLGLTASGETTAAS